MPALLFNRHNLHDPLMELDVEGRCVMARHGNVSREGLGGEGVTIEEGGGIEGR
jgi:hypothetical protein